MATTHATNSTFRSRAADRAAGVGRPQPQRAPAAPADGDRVTTIHYDPTVGTARAQAAGGDRSTPITVNPATSTGDRP